MNCAYNLQCMWFHNLLSFQTYLWIMHVFCDLCIGYVHKICDIFSNIPNYSKTFLKYKFASQCFISYQKKTSKKMWTNMLIFIVELLPPNENKWFIIQKEWNNTNHSFVSSLKPTLKVNNISIIGTSIIML